MKMYLNIIPLVCDADMRNKKRPRQLAADTTVGEVLDAYRERHGLTKIFDGRGGKAAWNSRLMSCARYTTP